MTKQKTIQKSWNDFSQDERHELRPILFNWLKSQRISNYGYDYRDFKNLSNQKYRASKKLISPWYINIDKNYGIFDRLVFQMIPEKEARTMNLDTHGSVWDVNYIVGQSFNEELGISRVF